MGALLTIAEINGGNDAKVELRVDGSATPATSVYDDMAAAGNGASAVVDALSSHISTLWDAAKREREDSGMDDKLLECQRQFKGEYDSKTLSAISSLGGYDGFRKLTLMKCESAKAWILDAMRGAIDKPWSLRPTPKPSPPPSVARLVAGEAAQEAVGKLGGIIPDAEVVEFSRRLAEANAQKVEDDLANSLSKRAKAMEIVMEDQLEEGGWGKAFTMVVRDFCVFPNAFMWGPFVSMRKELSYDDDNRPVVKQVPRVVFRHVSPFDIFPGPGSQGVDDSFLFHRITMSRGELLAMRDVDGWNASAIDKVLDEKTVPNTNDEFSSDNDNDKNDLENRTDDYKQQSGYQRLEGAIFYGKVSGAMLEEWGMAVLDTKAEYEVVAVKMGGVVVKATLNSDPLERRPYATSSYKKMPGAFWGMSLPEMMSDVQRQCNAAVRSLINNMGMGASPQFAMDVSQFNPSEKITSPAPFKIWQYDGSKSPNNRRALEVLSVPMGVNELLTAYQHFKGEADDVTGIPSFFYGSGDAGGAGNTASGLAMLQGNAQKGIKDLVAQLGEDIIARSLGMLFDWNMLYNPEQSIKGDAKIVVTGPLEVVTRDAMRQRRSEFLMITGQNPIDAQIIGAAGRAVLLRENLKTLDISPETIIPESKIAKLRAADEAPPMEDQAMAGGAG